MSEQVTFSLLPHRAMIQGPGSALPSSHRALVPAVEKRSLTSGTRWLPHRFPPAPAPTSQTRLGLPSRPAIRLWVPLRKVYTLLLCLSAQASNPGSTPRVTERQGLQDWALDGPHQSSACLELWGSGAFRGEDEGTRAQCSAQVAGARRREGTLGVAPGPWGLKPAGSRNQLGNFTNWDLISWVLRGTSEVRLPPWVQPTSCILQAGRTGLRQLLGRTPQGSQLQTVPYRPGGLAFQSPGVLCLSPLASLP